MRRKLFQGIKIGFISVLVVILVSLDNNPDNPMYYQAAFLFSMALPSIRKYLERAVMVEISKIPEANNGQPIVEPIVTPAITFCPFKNLKSVAGNEPKTHNSV